ncbi:MAG: PDZ domain-containing protein [Thermoanaerobaculia bacterium]|nr:PDZ domain-containing protein [Thermoanaerobaculia bacterium]
MTSNRRMLVVCALVLALFPLALGAQTPARQPMSEREFLDLLHDNPKQSYLGVQFVTQQQAGADSPRYRLEVLAVQPGGPADKAGIRRDDALVTLDGQPLIISDPLEVDIFFDPLAPGQAVKLGIIRGATNLDVMVTPAALTPELARAKQRSRRQMMKAGGIQTAEMLGRGEGTRLEIQRDAETGRLSVKPLEVAQQLSPIRLAALTVAFEESPVFQRAPEMKPGNKGVFQLRYDSETTTFNLDPIQLNKTAP